MSLQEIIELFGMERHRTAGWFSLHYSDHETWGRPKISSMYRVLAGDEPLPLHKLSNIEIWHYCLGSAAELIVTNGSKMQEISILGPDLRAGQRPQLAIPAHLWQSCRSLGKWTLLGCTMSPGYSSRSSFAIGVDDHLS